MQNFDDICFLFAAIFDDYEEPQLLGCLALFLVVGCVLLVLIFAVAAAVVHYLTHPF